MVFSSLTFLFIFLPVTLLGYRLLPKKLRIGFLLLASLIFYAWGEPLYVFLMIGSILVARPYRCVTSTAFVFGVIAASIFAASSW